MTSALSEIAENDVYTTENYLFSQKWNIFGIFAFSKNENTENTENTENGENGFSKYTKIVKMLRMPKIAENKLQTTLNEANVAENGQKWPLHNSKCHQKAKKVLKTDSTTLNLQQKVP